MGFLSCHDEDLSHACINLSGCSGVFWKAPSANSIRRFMSADC
jgi:hypothetical protein